jgi:DNA topoisomerase-1
VLKKKGRTFHRVLFHELTKKAILEAMTKAKDMDRDKYEAQQARRILDRLVGYQISPLLWRKVKGGLSAGRVQSVAVRIICDRERAIQAFTPVEYWSITANLKGKVPPAFAAKLVRKNGEKIEIPDEATATGVLRDLEAAPFILDKIVKRTTRRNPLPPFITSKLQQEAIQKLRFSAKKTMMVAQQLYEGIDLGPGEPVGLITYMRTDSTRIADEAAQEALALINERFGKEYAIAKPRFFKNKNKAQDAHEAIRPTSVYHTPDQVKRYLSKDQLALYTMIWQRFVASQMAQALIDQKTLSITAGDYTFTASGSSVKFPGFLALYQSADDEAESNKKSQPLPELAGKVAAGTVGHRSQAAFHPAPATIFRSIPGQGTGGKRHRPAQHVCSHPFHHSGQGLRGTDQKVLQAHGTGIYRQRSADCQFPGDPGCGIHRPPGNRSGPGGTGGGGGVDHPQPVLRPLQSETGGGRRKHAQRQGRGDAHGPDLPLVQKNPLRIKMGKNGHFLACSGYPECTYSSDYERDEKGGIAPVAPVQSEATDKVCELCGKPMVVKRGRYGDFLACTGYPECKHTQSLNGGPNAKSTGVACPEKGCDGEVVEKSSKRGKIFYGCNRYPKCSFASWDRRWPSLARYAAMPTWWKKQPSGTAPCMSAPTATAGISQAPDESASVED